jgi:inhibitor of KinA sporulation pathway (predicted exonuclease)
MNEKNYYLVVDLEATCDDAGAVPREQMEIIEIGAVLVDGHSLEAIEDWQSFVRPQRHPKLTPFCTELTSITQDQVDAAPHFPEVLEAFCTWWGTLVREGYGTPIFCSWGDYDRKQFKQDCMHHGLKYPLPAQHINVKREFSKALALKRKFGMAGALKQVGLPLVGTHHRGIDDARNIAKLLPWALGRVD